MIDPTMEDRYDDEPQAIRTQKRQLPGTGDLTRRYVHAGQSMEREHARRVKREERGA